jgi:preprotein translocase subunit SecD
MEISKWRILISILVCAWAVTILAPNFSNNTQGKKINLGLDLRGGAYLLLQIEEDKYFLEKEKTLKSEIRNKLREENIAYLNLRLENSKIIFSKQPEEKKNIKNILRKLGKDIEISIKGEQITINYTKEFLTSQKRKLLEQTLEIVRRRIDQSGTKEPLIQPQGLNRIILQVPGIKNPERLKTLLGKTAKMSFHILHPETPIVENIFYIPQGYKILQSEEDQELLHLVKEEAELTGEMLNDAQASIYQGKAEVRFKFDNIGSRKFGEVTAKNVGKQLAIILDDKIISAPVIREAILGGQGTISGNYSIEEANDLSILLRAGSLPAPITIIEERTVGPSLGQDSIKAGKEAILIGFVLVLLTMLIIYRKFGFFALLALFMNVIFIFAMLSLLEATLTLPGMAGIVLTVGMAVDTNVLIFERIREESRTDQSIYAVIDKGFTQAYKTIMDSNITTLLAAIILFQFGTGPVKGFAVTLILGILASLFSAIFLTKLLIYLWLKLTKNKNITI